MTNVMVMTMVMTNVMVMTMVMVMMLMVMLMVDLSQAGDDVGEVDGELIVGGSSLVVVALEEVPASNHFPFLVSSWGRCFCDLSFCYCHCWHKQYLSKVALLSLKAKPL